MWMTKSSFIILWAWWTLSLTQSSNVLPTSIILRRMRTFSWYIWHTTQLILRFCGNIVITLVPTLSQCWSPMFWWCWFVDIFNHPRNVVWTSRKCVNIVPMLHLEENPNVATTLSHNCVNVSAVMLPNIKDRLWDKIQTTWCEYCDNITPSVGEWGRDNVQAMLCESLANVATQCWGLRLRQHIGNVGWMLSKHWCQTLETDTETTFRQHCLNVVSMLVPNIGHQCWDNAQAMCECCINISAQLYFLGPE